MYKGILWSLLSLLILVIGVFIAIIYFDMNGTVLRKEVTPISDTENENGKEVVKLDKVELETDAEVRTYENPFHEAYEQEALKDRHYQDYIHKMSHQKVIADVKWGFYKITDERINWLLESLEKNYDVLHDVKVYRDILIRWGNGDFSRVDQDHNDIWRLQGGSIGEATSILSESEEKEYIESVQEE